MTRLKNKMIIIPDAENPEGYEIAAVFKSAHWIIAPIPMTYAGKGVSRAAVVCSNCKTEQNQEVKNYCANCGAKMK